MITGSQNVIAPVGATPKHRLRAMPLLPEEHDCAEHRGERQQIQQHGLQRQQH
jgi:hypothetical protein